VSLRSPDEQVRRPPNQVIHKVGKSMRILNYRLIIEIQSLDGIVEGITLVHHRNELTQLRMSDIHRLNCR